MFTSVLLLSACPLKARSHENKGEAQISEQNVSLLNYQKDLKQLLPSKFKPQNLRLLIDKTAYTLTVQYQNKAIKSYPVVFGFGYGPDKRREGDGATPEGIFKIRNLYPHPRWSKFIWIDYPTSESHRKHEAAKAAGEIPEDATVGSEIGIHGVPNNNNALIDKKDNWTAGCIALKNPDIDELYSVLSQKLIVEIIP